MYLFLYHEKGEATKTNFQCLDSTDLHIKRSALPIFQSVHTFLWSMFTGNKILYYQLMNSMDEVVSTAEVCRKFWKFPFMTASQQENHYLTALRDTLLPKLMSGELKIDKVEI